MDPHLLNQSPEWSSMSQTRSESSESNYRGDGLAAAPPEVAQLSCENCRKRKVKCSRRLPMCSLCEKLKHRCVYSSARKRPVRRKKYSELEERLQNMEKVLVESISGNQAYDTRIHPTATGFSQLSDSGSCPSYQGDAITLRPQLVDPSFAWNIPERGLFEPLSNDSMNSGPSVDPARYPAGSIPVFSARGTRWVDQLLGDSCFSTMVKELRQPVNQYPSALLTPGEGLPSHEIAEPSWQGCRVTVNTVIQLFEEDVIASQMKLHRSGSQELKTGYIAATNIMIAWQRFRCFPPRYQVDVDTEIYVANALTLIPRLIMEDTTSLNVGAILSMVLFLVFVNQCKPAASILGTAIQMMVTAGYNTRQEEPSKSILFQKRLFWIACGLSGDTGIYLGKAPPILDSLVFNSPERYPRDSESNLIFEDGSVLNVISERFAVSRMHGKVWSMLYSPNALELSEQQIYENVVELDQELEVWKSRIPDITGNETYDGNQGRLYYLSLINLRYYQLVISIHSILFTRASGLDPQVRKLKASPSVARCVQAARDSIRLLNHFHENSPFLCVLAPNIAWCCDVLCIHVLQNKNTPGAHQDIAGLERVAKIFEKFAIEPSNKFQSQVTNMLYFIAAYGVRVSNIAPEQPIDGTYEIRLNPFSRRTTSQDNYQPTVSNAIAQTGDYPAPNISPVAHLGMPVAPQYRDELSLRHESRIETNYAEGGRSFFVHIT